MSTTDLAGKSVEELQDLYGYWITDKETGEYGILTDAKQGTDRIYMRVMCPGRRLMTKWSNPTRWVLSWEPRVWNEDGLPACGEVG